MKVHGTCSCGFITFEAEIDPGKVAICHCTDCQILSGSAFRTVVPAAKAGFRLLAGQPKVYVKTAESGNKRVQAFCEKCGTPIYSSAVDDPPVYSIRVGTARQRAALLPRLEVFRKSALVWNPGLDGTKRFDGMPS